MALDGMHGDAGSLSGEMELDGMLLESDQPGPSYGGFCPNASELVPGQSIEQAVLAAHRIASQVWKICPFCHDYGSLVEDARAAEQMLPDKLQKEQNTAERATTMQANLEKIKQRRILFRQCACDKPLRWAMTQMCADRTKASGAMWGTFQEIRKNRDKFQEKRRSLQSPDIHKRLLPPGEQGFLSEDSMDAERSGKRPKVEESWTLEQAAQSTYQTCGLDIDCGKTRIEVRWTHYLPSFYRDCYTQDVHGSGSQDADEIFAAAGQQDRWESATITGHVQDAKGFGLHVDGPVWMIKYDQYGDCERPVRFTAKHVLVDLTEVAGRNEVEMEDGLGRCLWRKEGDTVQPPALLERSQKVKAKFSGDGKEYPGVLMKAHCDGTYFVQFEDGDSEENVARHSIREVDEIEGSGKFLDFCTLLVTSSLSFKRLSAWQQSLFAEKMRSHREEIMEALDDLKNERGCGTTVTRMDVDNILRRIGFEYQHQSHTDDPAPPMKEFTDTDGKVLSWRTAGKYIGKRTVRSEELIVGTIIGWRSREDSEKAEEDDKFVAESGEECDMWRNEHINGDYEDLDEGEVKAAIAAWEDYQSAVHRTEEMTRRDGVEGSGLQVEMHKTQIELFDDKAWEERLEIRWVKFTIEQYLPTRPILAEDNGISVWKLKYDGDAPDSYFPTYVGLVDRHSLMQFKGEETRFLDNVRWSWQETSDPLCFRWKLPDDDFLPAGVAEEHSAWMASLGHLRNVLANIRDATSLNTMAKVTRNCVDHPTDERKRRLRLSNEKIAAAMAAGQGKGMTFMKLLGWVEETQGGEKCIVLPSDVRLRVEQCNMIEEAKRSLETVPSF